MPRPAGKSVDDEFSSRRVDSNVCAQRMTARARHVVHGARRAIHVFDADGLALRRIHQHAMRHRPGDERQLAGRKSVGDGRERRVEVRMRRAAALARPAVMTGRAAVQRRGEVGGAPDRDQAIQLRVDTLAHRALRTRHRHRRLEHPVRQPGIVLSLPRHADVRLDDVVVRREVGIPDRPVDADAVARGGLEVEVAEAIGLTAPDIRAPADHPDSTHPRKALTWRRRVRLEAIVGVEAGVPLVARVGLRLLGARGGERRLRQPAVRQRRRRHVLAVVRVRGGTPGLEHRHPRTGRRQPLGHPPAGGPRPNHDRVESIHRCRCCRLLSDSLSFAAPSLVAPRRSPQISQSGVRARRTNCVSHWPWADGMLLDR